jgi:hypothetical protein
VDAQPLSATQAAAHAVLPHTYGVQALVVEPPQEPVVLQVLAVVWLPSTHVAAEQTVPVAYRAHAPAPLHRPLVPQVLAPWSAHSLSGSVLAVMDAQVPSGEPVLAAVQA